MFETDRLPQLLILLALLVQHCPSTKAQELACLKPKKKMAGEPPLQHRSRRQYLHFVLVKQVNGVPEAGAPG